MYGVEIAARTGVNTGEVVANTDPNAEQRLATGDAVNVAARLEQAAPANEVLIGDLTYSLVRSQVDVEAVEPLELKGKAERVPAYRLISVRDVAAVAERGAQESPLVGRDEQIGQLHDALSEVATLGGCRIVTVVGDAGVGKSHLVDTFRTELVERATVLRGRCLPYGDGITFWPLIEIARGAAGIVDDDPPERAFAKLGAPIDGVAGQDDILERLASVIGLSMSAFPVTEVFWAARKYLEALAIRRPVVVVIEDAHNGEETFLDLLEHLLGNTSKQASLLVVATGRLGLLEKRPEWGSRLGTSQVSMPPLAGDDIGRLVEVLLGGSVDPAVSERIIGSADGQPAVRVPARLAVRGQGPDPPRGRGVGGDGRPRRGRGPADDPGAARVAPRRPVARGAGGHGAGRGHRAVVPAAGRHRAGPRRAPAVGARAPALAGPQAVRGPGRVPRAARTRSTGSATS